MKMMRGIRETWENYSERWSERMIFHNMDRNSKETSNEIKRFVDSMEPVGFKIDKKSI